MRPKRVEENPEDLFYGDREASIRRLREITDVAAEYLASDRINMFCHIISAFLDKDLRTGGRYRRRIEKEMKAEKARDQRHRGASGVPHCD